MNLSKKDYIPAAEEKAKYEVEEEKERKRRFEILRGNIKPIHTEVTLKNEEHAFFEFETQRLALREYIESNTKGKTKQKGVVSRAIIGDMVFGRTGAVIGGLSGGSESQYKTTQTKVERTEVIDIGKMIFTNKRILFIGREVISIPLDDIFAVTFGFQTISIKFPSMLKNESYSIGSNLDVKLYYYGLMRLLHRDKSSVTEADISMADYPKFVSKEEKQATARKWLFIKSFIWIGVFIFIESFLRSNVINYTMIMFLTVCCCAIVYAGLWLMNKGRLQNYETGLFFTKEMLLWSLGIFGLCVVVGVINASQK